MTPTTMTMAMTARIGTGVGVGVAALLGLGAGLGLLLMLTGGHTRGPGRPWRSRLRTPAAVQDRRVLGRLAGALAAGVVAGVGTGWVAGALLAGLGAWALPRVLVGDREHARRVARIEAIASWTEMLRDTLAAAAGLEQAIGGTAPLAPAAIRPEVADLAARLRRGTRLAPGLRILADRLADPTADLVIAALLLAAEQQARQLADLLGSLARAAREQAAMRMRIAAGRARTRTSVRVIIATTVAFAVGMVAVDRPFLAAYDSPGGQLMLLVVGGLFAAGLTGLAHIATFPAHPRVLAGGAAALVPTTRRPATPDGVPESTRPGPHPRGAS